MLYFFTYKSSPSLSVDIVADIRCVGNRCAHYSLCGGQQAVALAANALRHAALHASAACGDAPSMRCSDIFVPAGP